MSDTYTELFFHFIWATKYREPMIGVEMEELLHGFIRRKCLALNVRVHALGGMPDHVHLACSVPPSLSLAGFLHDVKGASAYFINHHMEGQHSLCWQPGYGALTYDDQLLPRIAAYVANQKRRHAQGRLSEKMERIASDV